jgi:hypothetical protein
MKALRLLALLLPIGCAEAPAQNAAPDAQAAAPADEQAAIMDRIERDLRLPDGAGPLAGYSRYYAWQSREDGVRKVLAIYVREPNPAQRWVAETALPLIMDGGCGIVSLSYDVAAQRVEHIECNGEG